LDSQIPAWLRLEPDTPHSCRPESDIQQAANGLLCRLRHWDPYPICGGDLSRKGENFRPVNKPADAGHNPAPSASPVARIDWLECPLRLGGHTTRHSYCGRDGRPAFRRPHKRRKSRAGNRIPVSENQSANWVLPADMARRRVSRRCQRQRRRRGHLDRPLLNQEEQAQSNGRNENHPQREAEGGENEILVFHFSSLAPARGFSKNKAGPNVPLFK